jgi:hypothetical protein
LLQSIKIDFALVYILPTFNSQMNFLHALGIIYFQKCIPLIFFFYIECSHDEYKTTNCLLIPSVLPISVANLEGSSPPPPLSQKKKYKVIVVKFKILD